jgi:hypothetical protein
MTRWLLAPRDAAAAAGFWLASGVTAADALPAVLDAFPSGRDTIALSARGARTLTPAKTSA